MDIMFGTEKEFIEVERDVIIINGETFDWGDVWKLTVELEDTDCLFSAVLIHDSSLRNALENEGIIETNIRGSSCPGEKYHEFCALIENHYWERYE